MAYNPSAQHLAPAGGGFEPQRVFNYALLLPIDDVELIRLSVEKCQLPKESVAVMHLRFMNEDRKVAGAASVDSNSIVIKDFVDKKVAETVRKWVHTVHNPEDGKIGYASDYKRQATIQLLDPKGEIIRSVTAVGIWPSSWNFSDLDYVTETGDVKIMLTLQVDRYRYQL